MAQEFADARRRDSVTGVQAISELLKLGEITYSGALKRQIHTPFVVDRIDEVTTERVVDMLAALPE